MKNVQRSLIPKSNAWLNALLAPAEDPRQVFAAAHQRQQELMGKVRQARTNIAASKKRLQAKTEEVRNKLSQLESSLGQRPPDSGDGLARLAQKRRKAALEELHTLEQQVRMLEQDEWALSLIEQRLAAEIETLSTRQEVVAARYSTAEAQVRIQEALAGLSDELASLGLVLEQAEQRTEDMQAGAADIDRLVESVNPETPGLPVGGSTTKRPADGSVPADLKRLRKDLQTGLSRIESTGGLKALQGLVHQYDQLRRLLERRKSTDPLAVAYIPSLAEETYRHGLSVLADALALREAIESSDKERLQAEIIELESDIESLSKDETQATLVQLREEALASHKERLEIINRQQLRVDQLLHQSACCEASLDRTRMELASLKSDSAEANVSAVTETLLKTINQAREVQEELKRLGF